jgi:predicted GNAT superfamily acetyltransferase
MHLRDLTTLDEFRRVVVLEKLVWGYDDGEDVVPVPILAVTVRRGAILIGAFDDRNEMAGFVYSLPAFRQGRMAQWSHMLGVLEEHRGSGLGRRLKLEQRQRAIGMGLDLVEWTYDPLQTLNASLNFRRLGVIVREYEENIYGDSSSALHRGTPTDRFVAEWWIRTPRVSGRIGGIDEGVQCAAALRDVPAVTRLGIREWLACEGYDLSLAGPRLTVDIPVGFGEMMVRRPDLALEWRYATRAIFTSYFAKGYTVTDFVLDGERGSGRYVLELGPGNVQPGGHASRLPPST